MQGLEKKLHYYEEISRDIYPHLSANNVSFTVLPGQYQIYDIVA